MVKVRDWVNPKTAVFDLDGTIVDFVQAFATFARVEKIDRQFYSVHRACGFNDEAICNELTDQFYKSGKLAEAPVMDEWIIDLIRSVYKKQRVMFLTARPANLYPAIVKHTTDWLTANGLDFDILIFTDDKRKYIENDPNIHYVVEDNLTQAHRMGKTKKTIFLVDRPYNRPAKTKKNVIRIKNVNELVQCLLNKSTKAKSEQTTSTSPPTS